MRYLKIKNHDKYQHYSTRNPPWIKLYRSILTDYDLRQLPIVSRLTFIYLTIIASETDNRIPEDLKYLGDRFGFPVKNEHLTPLIECGSVLASSTSTLLAHDALCSSLLSSVPNSLNSSESEINLKSNGHASEFDLFWAAYPKKTGKKEALKAWAKAKDKPHLSVILAVLDDLKRSDQWTKENGRFIPNPATWINQGRWDDQPIQKAPSVMEAFLARGETNDPPRLR